MDYAGQNRMTDIKQMTKDELRAYFMELGEKSFRADQVFSWIHEKHCSSFSEMTNLSKQLREKLSETAELPVLQIADLQVSALDGTRKYLFSLADGNVIESVLMRYKFGLSVCVSSQVGCRMGCRFCASTIGGVVRNLKASEILDEVYAIERDTGETVSHVVVMGSGEPFDNYTEVVRFLRLLTDPAGQNMSRRNITVSTCGIPDKIRAFAEEDISIQLALSLHAPDDETRKKLMPVANRYSLSEVLAACDAYFEQTGRRVTYEYALVKGINADQDSAEKLGKLLQGRNALVNLIPVNRIRERNYEKPEREALLTFQNTLAKYGINATIRREMGADIQGACGQLRRSYTEHQIKNDVLKITAGKEY